ncbi:MAG: hypothetical protein JWQ28_632 [Pedobacter sp.]|jgi:uncharacterized protein YecE (DUF72 family)|nr:hypothetical protein [Pedobacter sp.]
MDFGKVTTADLNLVDHQLPPDAASVSAVLKKSSKTDQTSYFVGCAKWGRDEWKGLIYPLKTKAADFLNEYAKQFNAIELNASFYKVPNESSVKSWRARVEANATEFTFVPKFPKSISHFKKLREAEEVTERFVRTISGLGEHLGPCFLQLSDSFAPKDFGVLENYLRALPADFRVFVELRNSGWFSDPTVRAEVIKLFTSLNVGLVITDTSGRRDLLHMELTTPEAFIRFEGNGKEMMLSDGKRIEEWVNRIKVWVEQGLTSVYFFLHQLDEADTPKLASITIDELNKQLNAGLAPVQFISV